MERNTGWATSLLEYIEQRDHEGIGLYRDELRHLFEDDQGTHGVETNELWVVVDYHLRLLETAGFITKEADEDGKIGLDNFELTWAGHEYLENNRPHDFPSDFVVG